MIRISGIKLGIEDRDIKRAVISELRVKDTAIKDLIIRKKSLDARKKDDIHYIYTVDVDIEGGDGILKRLKKERADRI